MQGRRVRWCSPVEKVKMILSNTQINKQPINALTWGFGDVKEET